MKNTIRLSLPSTRKVRGYTIRRMPLGAFLGALETIQDIPGELMLRLFPGKNLPDILSALKSCDSSALSELLLRLLTVAPALLIELVAELTGIEEEVLRDDPALGVDGFAELIAAWVEVNGIENFIKTARTLTDKVRAVAAKPGCKS